MGILSKNDLQIENLVLNQTKAGRNISGKSASDFKDLSNYYSIKLVELKDKMYERQKEFLENASSINEYKLKCYENFASVLIYKKIIIEVEKLFNKYKNSNFISNIFSSNKFTKNLSNIYSLITSNITSNEKYLLNKYFSELEEESNRLLTLNDIKINGIDGDSLKIQAYKIESINENDKIKTNSTLTFYNSSSTPISIESYSEIESVKVDLELDTDNSDVYKIKKYENTDIPAGNSTDEFPHIIENSEDFLKYNRSGYEYIIPATLNLGERSEFGIYSKIETSGKKKSIYLENTSVFSFSSSDSVEDLEFIITNISEEIITIKLTNSFDINKLGAIKFFFNTSGSINKIKVLTYGDLGELNDNKLYLSIKYNNSNNWNGIVEIISNETVPGAGDIVDYSSANVVVSINTNNSTYEESDYPEGYFITELSEVFDTKNFYFQDKKTLILKNYSKFLFSKDSVEKSDDPENATYIKTDYYSHPIKDLKISFSESETSINVPLENLIDEKEKFFYYFLKLKNLLRSQTFTDQERENILDCIKNIEFLIENIEASENSKRNSIIDDIEKILDNSITLISYRSTNDPYYNSDFTSNLDISITDLREYMDRLNAVLDPEIETFETIDNIIKEFEIEKKDFKLQISNIISGLVYSFINLSFLSDAHIEFYTDSFDFNEKTNIIINVIENGLNNNIIPNFEIENFDNWKYNIEQLIYESPEIISLLYISCEIGMNNLFNKANFSDEDAIFLRLLINSIFIKSARRKLLKSNSSVGSVNNPLTYIFEKEDLLLDDKISVDMDVSKEPLSLVFTNLIPKLKFLNNLDLKDVLTSGIIDANQELNNTTKYVINSIEIALLSYICQEPKNEAVIRIKQIYNLLDYIPLSYKNLLIKLSLLNIINEFSKTDDINSNCYPGTEDIFILYDLEYEKTIRNLVNYSDVFSFYYYATKVQTNVLLAYIGGNDLMNYLIKIPIGNDITEYSVEEGNDYLTTAAVQLENLLNKVLGENGG